MKKDPPMTRSLGIALIILAAGAANAADKTLDRTFTVTPGGALIVDADSASVHVSGTDTNQVRVRMSANDSDDKLANLRFDAAQTSEGVTVTLRRPGRSGSWFNWRSWNGDQRLDVTVPQRYRVSVRTGGGSIELRDTIGAANLRTSGGDVAAKNVTGNVELRTSGGGIFAESIRGEVDADTSGGDVRVLQIDGKIRGNTSGGSVRCSLVGDNRGIVATTSGGDIELTLPRTATGNLIATTRGGDITSDLAVTASVLKDGHLRGTLNGGGAPVEAHTSGGNIRLRVTN
jgi:DUF4097 and DUF4098 domain-containing protein YvlB